MGPPKLALWNRPIFQHVPELRQQQGISTIRDGAGFRIPEQPQQLPAVVLGDKGFVIIDQGQTVLVAVEHFILRAHFFDADDSLTLLHPALAPL
jgi:hypothetical protein